MERYLVTHSLLSSWLYAMRDDPYSDSTNQKDAMAEFMTTLRREPTPTNDAMQKGIDFEDLVTKIVNGTRHVQCLVDDGELGCSYIDNRSISEHPWYPAAKKVAGYVSGGVLQYAAKCDVRIGERNVLLYGRLDALKGGTVYDIKYSGSYDVGKFIDSTQHPMYLQIVPEAREFIYLVSNGTNVWTEKYRREETADIRITVAHFFDWLKAQGLDSVFCQHWLAK